MEERRKMLLHCCCGPCSTAGIERLLNENWQPTLFFGNSNIYPPEENDKRWGELLKAAEFHGLDVIRAPYNHQAWLDFIKGLESCPEHGGRCLRCFEFNLSQAYEQAEKLGFKYFTTTLTVSRFKNSEAVFSQGRRFPGFVEMDFKKKDGFNRSVQLSRQLGLYRQTYCGCEFSVSSNTGKSPG